MSRSHAAVPVTALIGAALATSATHAPTAPASEFVLSTPAAHTLPVIGHGDPPTHRSTAADRETVSITVYNQDFALVREVRAVALSPGRSLLEFADIASSLQTETVHVESLGRSPFRVLEQNYRFDLLTPQKLLEKYVGRTVTLHRWNPITETEERVQAEVLSVNQGIVLRIGDEITTQVPGRLSFDEIPPDLIPEPTLVWMVDTPVERQRIEVSYLANQMRWKADYVLVVDDGDARGSLTGWVTLNNDSGATYENARLKLVAGDVQRLGSRDRMELARMVAAEAAADGSFSEEGFFEYHLYTLDRPTTVRNAEQKQVTLLESPGFGLTKHFIYYGAAHYYRGQYGVVDSNSKIGVFLDFENAEANGLGMALPAGVVRVYKADASGAQQFIGEDRIDHTPRDERVRIRMGQAFDIVGDRRQTEYRVLSSCSSESTWRVSLRNHKDEDVTVQVVEPVGGDWQILSASHDWTQVDAHTFTFDVPVDSRGETEVTYTVRVRWC